MQYSTQDNRHVGRWLSVMVIIVLLVICGFYWWHRDHRTSKKIPINTGTATINPNVPGGTTSNPTTGSSASKNQQTAGATKPHITSVQPATPTGQFVSNHRPNLSGSPTPNTETSACTTTPGVKCQIRFTSGNVVESLPPQTTDANGDTIWSNWTLQSIGLTAGTWQVVAIAINGAKTASAQDVNQLVVSP